MSKKSRREPATHAEDPLLSMREAAEMLGKNPTTISRWCSEGVMPYIRLPSGLYRVRRSHVMHILELRENDLSRS